MLYAELFEDEDEEVERKARLSETLGPSHLLQAVCIKQATFMVLCTQSAGSQGSASIEP